MSKTQLQQCREAYTAIEEEVTQLRIDTARWYEHRRAAETALYDMPTVLENFHSWRARAEAAEARVAELEVGHRTLLDQVEFHRIYALDAEIEVQRLRGELDALQAATEWRPIVGPPPADAFELKIICEVADDGTIYNAQTGATITYWTPRSDKTWRPIPPTHEELQ